MQRLNDFKIAFWNWVRNSGTVLWARVQYIFGIIFAGLIATFANYDFTQLASFDMTTAFKMLIGAAISGVITEFVRKAGTVVQSTTVSNAATNFKPVEVLTLERAEPLPAPPPAG